MIEISFYDFHEQNYEENHYVLYVMKNGLGDVLYGGISTVDVWDRWFGWGGHMLWDRPFIYSSSTIGEKIVNHLPDSLDWKIQLWTLKDCFKYCEEEFPDDISYATYNYTIRDIEAKMIRKLSPALNVHCNLHPGKDTTPKSQKEKDLEAYLDQAYDEIFNSKK